MAYGDPPAYNQIVSGFPSGGGVPPRMSLDAVACLSGVTTAQLGGLNGPFDGAVVVTTGASATGDGLGKAWVWVEGDTATANGTTILGAGAYGRWRDATALAGSGSSAGTSVTLNPAAGQITDASTVTASNIALAITGARVYTGLLAATGGQLVKVVTNTSAFDATFNHQDGSATAANRVITSSGTAFTLKAGKSATFAYDTTAQRWRIAGQDGGIAESFASVALASLSSPPGGASTAHAFTVGGRDSIGDGGGGDWDYLPTSSATVIPGLVESFGTGRRVRRRDWSGRVNIRWLGCKADGSTDNAALINAFIANRVADLNATHHVNVNLLVPYADDRQPGYYLGSGIAPGVGVSLDIRGEGMPYIEAFNFTQASSAARRQGSIFLVPAGVSAFPAISTGYQFLHLEDIGILGPGAPTSTVPGIDAHSPAGNFQLTGRNVRIAGCRTGLLVRNLISSHAMYAFKAHGCDVGFQFGVPSGAAPFDCSYYNFDAEYNRLGVKVCNGMSNRWHGGLVQSNGNGWEWGDAAGGCSVTNFGFFPGPHMEGNGPNSSYGLSSPYEMRINSISAGAGNAYDNIDMHQLFGASGISLSIPGGYWVFTDCRFAGPLTISGGATVVNRSSDPLGGFTGVTVDINARYIPTKNVYPISAGTVSGTYKHNWATMGEFAQLNLGGNLTLQPPDANTACTGARILFRLRQDTTGGRTVSFASGLYLARPWSDAGNGANAYASIEFISTNGAWVEQSRTEWGGFDESTVISSAAPLSWIRADNVTLSGGRTDAFMCKIDGSHLYSFLSYTGGGGIRAEAPIPLLQCNHREAVSINPFGAVASACGYQSNKTAAYWSFLRTGTFEIWLVCRTKPQPAADVVAYYLSTGNATRIFDYGMVSGAENFRNYPECSLNTAQQKLSAFRLVRVIGTGNGGATIQMSTAASGSAYTMTPNGSALTSNLDAPLCIGLQPITQAYAASLELCDMAVFDENLSTANATVMWSYIAARYGLSRWSF